MLLLSKFNFLPLQLVGSEEGQSGRVPNRVTHPVVPTSVEHDLYEQSAAHEERLKHLPSTLLLAWLARFLANVSFSAMRVEKGSELRPKVSVGHAEDVAMALLQQLS